MRFRSEQFVVAVVLAFIAILTFIFSPKPREFIWTDAEGYYMYLPALTIYGFSDIPIRSTNQFFKVESTGRYYDKYTGGVAIMQAPFYGIACVYAALSGKYEVDGYSQPFQYAVFWAALFYAFAGLFMVYKVLCTEYTLKLIAPTLFCIFFGTNMFYYTHNEPGMAHIYAFFLWAALIWQTSRLYVNATWKNFILLSLIVGLLVFIRPSNAIGALLILLWNFTSIRERIAFMKVNFLKFAILVVPFAILFFLQILIWKSMLGETVLFSYNSEPGFIYLAAPKIGNVLFHVHNGLFIYAPVLLLAVIGLFFGIEKKMQNFMLYGVILLISTYIFASWWAWWFGGAYGHRCYIDLLPLFAFPLIYLFKQIAMSKFFTLKVFTAAICAVLVYYSVGMSKAYRSPWDGPGFGWPEYWAIVNSVF